MMGVYHTTVKHCPAKRIDIASGIHTARFEFGIDVILLKGITDTELPTRRHGESPHYL